MRYTYIRQHDTTDCAAACMAMVCLHYKKETTIANIMTKEGLSHFVVVFKVTPKYVVLGDPAKDLMKIKTEEFYQQFTGVLLLLTPQAGFVKEKIKDEQMFSYYMKLLLPHNIGSY